VALCSSTELHSPNSDINVAISGDSNKYKIDPVNPQTCACDYDQSVSEMIARYLVLLGDIDLQRPGRVVLYPVQLVTDYCVVSYIYGGGGIEPHTRVVTQGLTPYCDRIVTVLLVLFSRHIATELGILRRRNLTVSGRPDCAGTIIQERGSAIAYLTIFLSPSSFSCTA